MHARAHVCTNICSFVCAHVCKAVIRVHEVYTLIHTRVCAACMCPDMYVHMDRVLRRVGYTREHTGASYLHVVS